MHFHHTCIHLKKELTFENSGKLTNFHFAKKNKETKQKQNKTKPKTKQNKRKQKQKQKTHKQTKTKTKTLFQMNCSKEFSKFSKSRT